MNMQIRNKFPLLVPAPTKHLFLVAWLTPRESKISELAIPTSAITRPNLQFNTFHYNRLISSLKSHLKWCSLIHSRYPAAVFALYGVFYNNFRNVTKLFSHIEAILSLSYLLKTTCLLWNFWTAVLSYEDTCFSRNHSRFYVHFLLAVFRIFSRNIKLNSLSSLFLSLFFSLKCKFTTKFSTTFRITGLKYLRCVNIPFNHVISDFKWV